MQFRRRIKVAPGVHVNVSKGGLGLSIGGKGLHYTIGPKGPHMSFGIPGTGVYYRQKLDGGGLGGLLGEKEKKSTSRRRAADEEPAPRRKSTKRSRAADQDYEQEAGQMVSPRQARIAAPTLVPEIPAAPALSGLRYPEEKLFREGAVLYVNQQYAEAFDAFSQVLNTSDQYVSDALLLTALTASYLGQYDTAMDSLVALVEQGHDPLPGEPGSLTAKYLPGVTVNVPVTQFSSIDAPLNIAMATLLLTELLQAQGRIGEAIQFQEDMFNANPNYPILQLGLADLYSTAQDYDMLYSLFVNYPQNLDNSTDLGLELMYYWGIALTIKGQFEAAEDVYKRALKNVTKRNPELVKVVEYGRADMYERWGKLKEAYKYFSALYSKDPRFYDIADRVAALQQNA